MRASPPGHTRSARVGRFARWWLLAFAAFTAMELCWTLATPLFDSPDEPTQVIRAAAAAHGELVGARDRGEPEAITVVRVPATFAEGGGLGCYVFRPAVPAGCVHPLRPSAHTVTAITYVGRDPPLYFLLVGLPSLVSARVGTIYAMRVISDLLVAAMLALAFATAAAWSRSRLLPVGVAAAATPTLFAIGATVNPSGLEIAAGIAVWTAGSVLVLDGGDAPPAGLLWSTGVAASVFCFVRGLSPFYVAVIGVLLVVLAGRRRLATLLRRRAFVACLAAIAGSGALASAWILVVHSNTVLPIGSYASKHAPLPRVAVAVLGQTGNMARGMVGLAGWNVVHAPALTILLWAFAVGALVGLGLSTSSRRLTAVLVATIGLVVAIPVVLTVLTARQDGLIWQARYTLPFAAGVPILGAAGLGDQPVLRRLGLWLASALGLGQVAFFVIALERNVEGLDTNPLSRGIDPYARVPDGWAPPLPAFELTALFAACCAAAIVLTVAAHHRRLDAGPDLLVAVTTAA